MGPSVGHAHQLEVVDVLPTHIIGFGPGGDLLYCEFQGRILAGTEGHQVTHGKHRFLRPGHLDSYAIFLKS